MDQENKRSLREQLLAATGKTFTVEKLWAALEAGTAEKLAGKYQMSPSAMYASTARKKGDTPLHYAAKTGQLSALKSLWPEDAKGLTEKKCRQRNNNKDMLFHLAARHGCLDQLRDMMDQPHFTEASVIASTGRNGETPIHAAAIGGTLNTLLEMVPPDADHGVTPRHCTNFYDNSNKSPFQLAALHGTLNDMLPLLQKNKETPFSWGDMLEPRRRLKGNGNTDHFTYAGELVKAGAFKVLAELDLPGQKPSFSKMLTVSGQDFYDNNAKNLCDLHEMKKLTFPLLSQIERKAPEGWKEHYASQLKQLRNEMRKNAQGALLVPPSHKKGSR